jgi:hypothetical protein
MSALLGLIVSEIITRLASFLVEVAREVEDRKREKAQYEIEVQAKIQRLKDASTQAEKKKELEDVAKNSF